MNVGYVYILEFEKEIKIGRTKNPEQRINCIETTRGERVKRSFISERCSNYFKIEVMLHRIFKDKRNVGEYFNCDFDEVVLQLSKMDFITVTDEEIEISNEEHFKKIEKTVKEIVERSYKNAIKEINNEKPVHCHMCQTPIDVWNSTSSFENCDKDKSCEIYYLYSDIQDLLEHDKINIDDFKEQVLKMISDFKLKSKVGMYNELIYSSFDLGIINENTYKSLLINIEKESY
jgi:hypothetical protein